MKHKLLSTRLSRPCRSETCAEDLSFSLLYPRRSCAARTHIRSVTPLFLPPLSTISEYFTAVWPPLLRFRLVCFVTSISSTTSFALFGLRSGTYAYVSVATMRRSLASHSFILLFFPRRRVVYLMAGYTSACYQGLVTPTQSEEKPCRPQSRSPYPCLC